MVKECSININEFYQRIGDTLKHNYQGYKCLDYIFRFGEFEDDRIKAI